MKILSLEHKIRFLKYPVLWLFFSLVVSFSLLNLYGLDYFFHIKSGQYILDHKTVPKEDVFSFTREGTSWTNHEWLYQVLLGGIHRAFGIQGLFFLRAGIFSLLFLLLAGLLLRTDWVLGIPLLFFGLQITLYRFLLRPDNFSLVFAVLFLLPFILKKRRMLFLLPFLQILWVNSHGFYFLGPLILGVFLLSGKNGDFSRPFYGTAKRMFFCSLLACLVNPYPLQTLWYPFGILRDLVTPGNRIIYRAISELRSPFADISLHSHFFIYLFCTALPLTLARRRHLFFVLVWLLLTAFSLHSLRNIYFYLPASVILFVAVFPEIKRAVLDRYLTPPGITLLHIIVLVWLLPQMFGRQASLMHASGRPETVLTGENGISAAARFFETDPSLHPDQMIAYMETHPLPERMFNDFNSGAQLIFKFFPDRKVFIDGRTELYGHRFFSRYERALKGDRKVLEFLIDRYRLRGFLISYTTIDPPPIIGVLHEQGYTCVYFGPDGIIFIDPGFYERHRGSLDKVSFSELAPEFDLQALGIRLPSVSGHFRKAQTLHLLGFLEPSRRLFRQIVQVYPSHAPAYRYLAKIAYARRDFDHALLAARTSLFFDPDAQKTQKLLTKIYLNTDNKEEAARIAKKFGIKLTPREERILNAPTSQD
ncbi:MAG: hypothetical protein GF333_03675 [Candidatus Omnitrophica bacterium]|nr:hypothetical protein [Candidatus Omnitrophota bacterium]